MMPPFSPAKKNTKIDVVTLGCAKNVVESEVLLGLLKDFKYDILEHKFEDAVKDIVIINTCAFTQDAKQESIEEILLQVRNKEVGFVKKIVVIGCLAQRYKDTLKKNIPEIDFVYGIEDMPKLLENFKMKINRMNKTIRHLTSPKHYAYLKISDGCDRSCSFCAIPTFKGKHVSRTKEDIIEEVKFLVKKGVREIILVAQDLTYYGLDIYKKQALAELIDEISNQKGVDWLRLHYAYPANFPLDVLEVMNAKDNICKYLDIPFQHISDDVLLSMNRGHKKKETYKLIETIRKKVPGIVLRTSLIVGYPTETENEFKELVSFVKDIKFDRLGVFKYSREEGTKAYKLKDLITEKVKQKRYDEIMKIQKEVSYNLNQAKIGKTFKVLIDSDENDDITFGRTQFDSPEIDNTVLFAKDHKYKLQGKFIDAKIVGATEYDLYGETIKYYK